MDIGARIRDLRQKRGLTQEELADRCELTKGYISMLENDVNSPTILTLKDILSALGTTLGDFFAKDDDDKKVFSSEDYIVKEGAEGVITWLVPNSQKNLLEPILVELTSEMEDMAHEGEEFGYVFSGTVMLRLGKKEYLVRTGETFYYTSDKVHSIKPVGEKATLIWITTPPNF